MKSVDRSNKAARLGVAVVGIAAGMLCAAVATAGEVQGGVTPPAAELAHTPVPTVAEWDAVEGEITVNGSSALACQTKALREWVRISCRGTDPQRGKPTGVVITNSNNTAEKLTLSDRTSLVFRFEQGTKLEATFKWTRLTKKFISEWPAGAPKPTAYGKFL